jgi:hypothetical protein
MAKQSKRVFVTPRIEPEISFGHKHSQLSPDGLVRSEAGGRDLPFTERMDHLRFLLRNANGPQEHFTEIISATVNGC